MTPSRLTQAAISKGLEPRVSTIETPTLHNAIYGAALGVLNRALPELERPVREALARNIALRCDRAVATLTQKSERAA